MYLSQHRFTPAPEKFDRWLPYNWNYMTLTARAKGAVLSRILRISNQPESFFAIGLWTDKDHAISWSQSEESRLGAKPSVDQGLYDGYPMEWSRWTLADFAWGRAGPRISESESLFVRHVVWDIAPGSGDAQATACRIALSLLARRPGIVRGETYLSHRNDRLLLIHSYDSADAWPFGGDLPDDLLVLRDLPAAKAVADSLVPSPQGLTCTPHQVVWGPDAAAIGSFILTQAA